MDQIFNLPKRKFIYTKLYEYKSTKNRKPAWSRQLYQWKPSKKHNRVSVEDFVNNELARKRENDEKPFSYITYAEFTNKEKFLNGEITDEVVSIIIQFLDRITNGDFSDELEALGQKKEPEKATPPSNDKRQKPSADSIKSEQQKSPTSPKGPEPKSPWRKKTAIGALISIPTAATLVTIAFFFTADEDAPSTSPLPEIANEKTTPTKKPKLVLNDNIQKPARVAEAPKKRISIPVGKYYADAMALSSDGRLIAVSDFDWIVNVYYADSGLLAAKFQGHEGRVFSIAFSPDGELIATGSSDGTVRIWSLGQKREIRKFRDTAENRSGSEFLTTRVAFSPDGKLIAFSGRNNTVEIVRFGDSYVVSKYETQLPVRRNSADRDSACKYPLSPSPECVRASRAARDRRERDSTSLNSAATPVEDIAYSTDGRFIATISHGQDSDVQIYDWKDEKFLDRVNFRTKFGVQPRSLAFSPSKQQLAVIGEKKVGTTVTKGFVALVLYKLSSTSKPRINYQAPAPGISLAVDFSTDGRMVAFPIEAGFVIFDAENKIEVRKITDECTHRHVQLAGGWPPLLAADFCDGNGITVQPLNQLK